MLQTNRLAAVRWGSCSVAALWLGFSILISHAGAASEPVSLGKLDTFWRYSAALGPFLEGGQALIEIPEYATRSDFPYRKRPFPQEVPFADHLSIVRLIGGYNDGEGKHTPADPNVRERDLVYRDAAGKLQYRMNLLRARLQPYLNNGYTNFTLVLDNIPWCFPAKPIKGSSYGQTGCPRDPKEWGAFIKAMCVDLKQFLGEKAANQLRFRIGTEYNGTARFTGTQAEFLQHYDHAAAAVKEVLPGASFGPYNISAASLQNVPTQNVNALALAEHCMTQPNFANGMKPTPFDWVAYSRYYKCGDDPLEHQRICKELWDEFGRRWPQLKNVSREIHEFGVAPFGEVAKGDFPSAENGALGAALTCQMMWRLREAGINRLWHWGISDTFRDRKNTIQHLFVSKAWLLSVFEQMAGGDAYLFPPMEKSAAGASYVLAGSIKPTGALFMLSAYNRTISKHGAETVRFRVPNNLLRLDGKKLSFVRLNAQTAVYDRIRRELAAAKLLSDDFVSRPDRSGSIRQMSKDRGGERLVGEHLEEYQRQYVESLTLHPLTDAVARVSADASGQVISASLSAPEVLAIMVKP